MASQLTADDVGKLKVTELRAELKARDLPTTGLKKELADRLLETISGTNGEVSAMPSIAAEEVTESNGDTSASQAAPLAAETTANGTDNATAATTTTTTAVKQDSTGQTAAEAPEPIATSAQAHTTDLPSEMPAVPPAAAAESSVQDYEGVDGLASASKDISSTTTAEQINAGEAQSEVVRPKGLNSLDQTPGFVADSRAEETVLPAPGAEAAPSVLHDNGAGDESLKRKHEEVEPTVEPAPESVAAQAETAALSNDSISAAPATDSILAAADEREAKRPRTDTADVAVGADAVASSEAMVATLSTEDNISIAEQEQQQQPQQPPQQQEEKMMQSASIEVGNGNGNGNTSLQTLPSEGAPHSLTNRSNTGNGGSSHSLPRLTKESHQDNSTTDQKPSTSSAQNDNVATSSTSKTTNITNSKEVTNKPQPSTSNSTSTSNSNSHSSAPIPTFSDNKPSPARGICISNLVRPFTLPSLKSKLEEFGEIDYFWINSIKSHCFVTYITLESAESASRDLQDQIWPEIVGKPLSIIFIPPESIPPLVAKEENAGRSVRHELVLTRRQVQEEQNQNDTGKTVSSEGWIYDVQPFVNAGPLSKLANGSAPPVPRGLASSLPLQARPPPIGGVSARGGTNNSNNTTTLAISATGSQIQLPSGSAFVQTQMSNRDANRGDYAGIWEPKSGNEAVYERTKTEPKLWYRPVDMVAAGRRLRELERVRGGGAGSYGYNNNRGGGRNYNGGAVARSRDTYRPY